MLWSAVADLRRPLLVENFEQSTHPFQAAADLFRVAAIADTEMRGRVEEVAGSDGGSVLVHQARNERGRIGNAAKMREDDRPWRRYVLEPRVCREKGVRQRL